jgi:hypothetical protein
MLHVDPRDGRRHTCSVVRGLLGELQLVFVSKREALERLYEVHLRVSPEVPRLQGGNGNG